MLFSQETSHPHARWYVKLFSPLDGDNLVEDTIYIHSYSVPNSRLSLSRFSLSLPVDSDPPKVENETKEKEKTIDFDLPELSEEEYHDSMDVPSVETQKNIVLTLWQFIMSIIFFEFLEKNRKHQRAIANEPVAATQPS